ncbi:MAG: two-component sensor histidine kinase [Archangium gephyra]|uniref:histidine kinase n=1 Tax=Archangium gephyra TaxID=48 RepID=A0A2W5VV97_9BACT|nr:MAG: two-component sensor histidine kinase [Archangium gephyra]
MSLRARLLLAFLLPALLVLAVGGYLLFRASRNTLEEELGRSLAAIAASVASQLKAERVLSIEAGDASGEGSRTWRSLNTQLVDVKERTRVRRIYVVDAQRRARLDAGGKLETMAEATELLRDPAEVQRALDGRLSWSQVLFEGNDGLLYKTGYAPLLADGRAVGLVAVEGSAQFFGPLRQLRNAFIVLSALTLLLLAIAAFVMARGIATPLERLVSAALRIGRGDLSTPVTGEPTREIGILSRELEAMRQAIESRDRQLKLMLGGVAHEVKNPLGGMELFAGLLDEELASAQPNNEDAREHLVKIRRELQYLKRIVEDFLAFAKEQRVQLATVEARTLLEGAAQHMSGEAESRGVTVSVDAQPGNVEVDASLMTSALVNLVKNAVQISTAGQTVTIRGRVDGARYELSVHDDGPGISTDLQARIFEPFFTTREKGTGLGLPLAKKLAEAHRGTLTLESTPGSTTFRLSLPRKS